MGGSPTRKRRTGGTSAKSATRRRGKAAPVPADSDSDVPSQKARKSSKRKVKAPKKADADFDDDGDTGAARVYWDKDHSRTERLLEWLTKNVDDRLNLFSDSTKDAHKEGRRKKDGKTTKMAYYLKIADAVFSVDANESVREDYLAKPIHYARSVDNYVSRLQKRYGEFNKELGQTGAGLRAEDVIPGSEIANKTERMKLDFPYWECLHGFWRTLPNFNPFTVSSEPGQNIADQAIALLTGGDADDYATAGNSNKFDDDEPTGVDAFNSFGVPGTPKSPSQPDSSEPRIPWSPSPGKKTVIDVDDDNDMLAPKPQFELPKKLSAVQNSIKANISSSDKSSTSSVSSAVKPSKKRSRTEAFAEENQRQQEVLAELGKNKHERRMAELSVKRQRLQIDLQRENLAAEERRLAADDRCREAEYKREREREQHQLMMMRMQFAMQNGGNGIGGGIGGGLGGGIGGLGGGLGSDAGFVGGGEMDGDVMGAFGSGLGGATGFSGAGPSSSTL